MGAVLVQNPGAVDSFSGAGQTTAAYNWATSALTPTVGNKILFGVDTYYSAATTVTMTDNASPPNTYTARAQVDNAKDTQVVWFECDVTHLASGGGLISTLNFTGASVAFPTFVPTEWSGLTTAGFDTSATIGYDPSTTTTFPIGPTGTLAQAAELAVSIFSVANSQATVGYSIPSGWTVLQLQQDDNAFNSTATAYEVVASTTAISATWTASTGVTSPGSVAGSIATFKIASASVPAAAPFVQQTAAVGATATFTPGSYSNSPTSYQWYRNGVLISGATSSSYTTPTVASTDNGAFFSVVATNGAGAGPAVGAYLFVPNIKTQYGQKTESAWLFKRDHRQGPNAYGILRKAIQAAGPGAGYVLWGNWWWPAASGLTASIAESGTAASTQSATSAQSATGSESGAAADTPSATAADTAAISEAGSGADTSSNVLGLASAIAESGSAGDTPASALAAAAAIAESGAAADSNSSALAATVTASEAGSAADSPAGALAASSTVAESGSAADTPAGSMTAAAAIAESGSAAETESASVSGGGSYSGSASESGSAAETESAIAAMATATSEAGSAADTPSAGMTAAATTAEAGSAADTPASSMTAAGTVAEAGTAVESESASMAAAGTLAEAGSAADTESSVNGKNGTVAESGSAADTPASSATMTAVQAEAGAAVDQPTGTVSFSAQVTEAGFAFDLVALLANGFVLADDTWVVTARGATWHVGPRSANAAAAARRTSWVVGARQTEAQAAPRPPEVTPEKR